MITDKFIQHLAAELINSVNNNYSDNYDYYRYGKEPPVKKKASLKRAFVSLINKRGYFNNFNNHLFSSQIERSNYPVTDFIYLHNNLEDEYSKQLLIKIVAYRLLGHKKVRLPLSTPEFWNNQNLIEAKLSKNDTYPIGFMDWKLHLIDLGFLGYPIKMYNSSLGVNILFIIKQYEFHRNNIQIAAEEGDTVIDGGGCYGDTALYFADKIGPSGKVHVFEFIPDNIKLFSKNIEMNPELAQRIELVSHPLWEDSGKHLYYLSSGPGSRVSAELFDGYTGETRTMAIDDYVETNAIEKIDLIKMDIEGAEWNALKGATETIKRFKPKLAIALYHSTKDFDIIPRYINDLNLGYELYLSHATIYGEETMLFAKVE